MKALVTGASSGIGYEISKYLSKLGYDLIIVARNEEKLLNLKAELQTNTQIILKDLSTQQNCIDLYEEVKNQEIDILVNNAGFGTFGEFVQTDLQKEINIIDTNITAVHILTKKFLQDMVEKDKGYILNVSSLASFAPGPLMATYYSTKAYVTRLTESIHKELKKKKSSVKISALCPGPVNTNFNAVAGVEFSIKSLSSEYVAKYGIDKTLKGKLIIVPGLANRIIRALAKITPNKISAELTYNHQQKKNK